MNDISKDPLKTAIASGSYDVVKYFVEQKQLKIPERSLFLAAESGSLETVKYLHQMLDLEIKNSQIKVALEKGFIDIGRYLIKNFPSSSNNLDIEVAAMSGDLNLFKIIEKNHNFVLRDITKSLDNAIRTYNNNIAKYIINEYPEIFDIANNKKSPYLYVLYDVYSSAIFYDNLEILSLLVKNVPSIAEKYPARL